MIFSSRNFGIAGVVLAGVVVACSSDESKFNDGANNQTPTFTGNDFGDGGSIGPDLYKNDPLPQWCGPDAGQQPPAVTGTEDCPSDKNKPGCGCDTVGQEAACWDGLRKQRGLGICKDGKTKCIAKSETGNQWGPCEGEVLPKVGGSGADACSCFSAGEWNIRNTNPCLVSSGDNAYAYSTVLEGDKITHCFENGTQPMPVDTAPPGTWSTNTLKVDCAGTYKLIFRIKAGDFNHPNAGDCTLGEMQTEVDYTEAGKVQTMPDLPTWFGTDHACAKKWEIDTPPDVSPGYGEMVVRGKTVQCNEVDDGSGNDFVFHRVQYCPRVCRTNPGADACKACQTAATGTF